MQEDLITFDIEWLSLPKGEFRLLVMIADIGGDIKCLSKNKHCNSIIFTVPRLTNTLIHLFYIILSDLSSFLCIYFNFIFIKKFFL